MTIPITKPFFGAAELEAVQKPLQTGWVVQGPFVKDFEDRFSAFTAAAHSVATSSCTTALHIAMAALGLKPGDEVIVPAFTWVATANVVEYMGAKPVFCDVDLATFNVRTEVVDSLITSRTVASFRSTSLGSARTWTRFFRQRLGMISGSLRMPRAPLAAGTAVRTRERWVTLAVLASTRASRSRPARVE